MDNRLRLQPRIVTPALLALMVASLTAMPVRAEMRCSSKEIVLRDAYSGWQLLVSDNDRDVTHDATYTSKSPAIARVDSHGYVMPRGNGSTVITISRAAAQVEIPVTVTGFGNGRSVDFQMEIVPMLTKAGCNSGGCHGKASGQKGFKLSLFGFDPAFDYDAIVREARGRRVFPAAPDQSLLLLKATAAVPHGGGKRIVKDSHEYQVLLQWMQAGTPASAPDAPHVKKLQILPGNRVMAENQVQQLAVLAEYSDGSLRDVTRQSEYSSNLTPVAAVDGDGVVRAGNQSGEAAVMARHMGYVAVFRAMVPHGKPLTEIPEFQPANFIDELAVAKWKQLGLRPSPLADDVTFLRRVTLDLCGRLPTAAEVRAFQADASPDKRAHLIDRLLDSPDYPAYFALKWSSILRNSQLAGADQAAVAFHGWIKDSIARNRPYDEFVRGIVAAAGEWQDAPAINWYWQNRDDQLHMITADTAQIFLGVRLQCARCHHHPYERWGQADYYGLAGFFARVGRKDFGQPPPYYVSSTPTISDKNPLTGKTPEPKYLDGAAPKFSEEEDPRHALVDWMAKPDNPYFARALVNRMWGHFLGRGLVAEVDDLRETNPPSNPELLDALAAEFVKHKFDVKHVIRLILNSRVYQLSSEPTEHNRNDRQNFARYYARRLPAEVLVDAVNQATGTKTTFERVSSNTRAVELPHEGYNSYFMDVFDRPKRVTVCECERSTSPTLSQVLQLAISDEVEQKVNSGQGVLARLQKEKKTDKEIIEEFYLGGLSRLPTPREMERCQAHVKSAGEKPENKKAALEDILWAIVNTREFLYNH